MSKKSKKKKASKKQHQKPLGSLYITQTNDGSLHLSYGMPKKEAKKAIKVE